MRRPPLPPSSRRQLECIEEGGAGGGGGDRDENEGGGGCGVFRGGWVVERQESGRRSGTHEKIDNRRCVSGRRMRRIDGERCGWEARLPAASGRRMGVNPLRLSVPTHPRRDLKRTPNKC